MTNPIIICDGDDFVSDFRATRRYEPDSDTYAVEPDMPLVAGQILRQPCQPGVVEGNNFHVFGGFTFPPVVFRDTHLVFNRITSLWSLSVPMPAPKLRGQVAFVPDNNSIYVHGGQTTGSVLVHTLFRYDVALGTWSIKTPSPVACPVTQGAVFVLNGKIHLVAGIKSTGGPTPQTNAHFMYDPVADGWTTLAPIPNAGGSSKLQDSFSGATLGKGYVIGGLRVSPGSTRADVFEYDVGTDSWTLKTPIPVPLRGSSSATSGSRIYCFAGSAEYYDAAVDSGTSVASVPVAIGFENPVAASFEPPLPPPSAARGTRYHRVGLRHVST